MPKRIQRKRTKGWKMPPNTVSVCRPGPFGNPFSVGAAADAGHKDPQATAVLAFSDWLNGDPWACGNIDRSDERKRLLGRLHELRGKDLACWCPLDQPCHADVLLRLANQ